MTEAVFESGAVGKVSVDGIRLAFEWWPGQGSLVGLHGLTSHRRAFAGIADFLTPKIGVLAFDLRGRGDSDKQGPFGIARHAEDVAAALDQIGLTQPVVIAGHSMGAYVATAFAAKFPDRTRAVALFDGGFFLMPEGADPDQLMEAVLATFMERLRTTWASVEDLCSFFESTPMYAGRIDACVRRYFEYDLGGEPGSFKAKASEAAAAEDWRDLLTNPEVKSNLERVKCPALLVRAPEGLMGVGDAVIPDIIREEIEKRVPHIEVVDLPGENHHSMLTTYSGARRTAEALERFVDGLGG